MRLALYIQWPVINGKCNNACSYILDTLDLCSNTCSEPITGITNTLSINFAFTMHDQPVLNFSDPIKVKKNSRWQVAKM